MNKKIIIPVVAIAILGTGITGVGLAQADESSSNPHQAIIERLSERFGLNENDVEAVFEEAKRQRQNQRQQQYNDRLAQLVKDGKITPEQKNLIIKKRKEMKEKKMEHFGNLENYDLKDMRGRFKNHKGEFYVWAKENSIDLQYFYDGKGPRNHHN